jgi:hypothetical protein
MAGFRLTEWIERRPEDVFSFAANLDNAPKWINGVVRAEKLTDGPIRVGTRFRETRRFGKREHSAEIEVLAHDPPRTHAAGGSFPGGQAVYRYTFAPERNGTRVDMEAEVRGRGLGWLMVPLMVAAMKKADGDHLAALKRNVEAAPR